MPSPRFTWTPSWATTERSAPRARNAQLGPLQSLAAGSDGNNTDLKTWNVSFENLIPSEMEEIEEFLTARNGAELFQWTNPRGITSFYVCEQWSTVAVARNIWTIQGAFRQIVAWDAVLTPDPEPNPDPEPPLIGATAACVSISPLSAPNKVAFHPSGKAVAVTRMGQPYFEVYRWSDDARVWGAKYNNPAVLPSGSSFSSGFDVAFSPSGNALIVVGNFTEKVAAYQFSLETGLGNKITTAPLPLVGSSDSFVWGNSVAFHPSGNAVAIAHWGAPYVSAWSWSDSTGFLASIASPSPAVNNVSSWEGRAVAFNPAGTALVLGMDRPGSVGQDGWVVAWQWANGFGSRIPGFVRGANGTDAVYGAAFSPNGQTLVVVGGGSGAAVAFIWSYPFSLAGFGAAREPLFTGAPEWPPYQLFSVDDVAFSPSGDRIAVAQSGGNNVYTYAISETGEFTAYVSGGCAIGSITGVAYSPVSGSLAAAGTIGSVGGMIMHVNSLYERQAPSSPPSNLIAALSGDFVIQLTWTGGFLDQTGFRIERSVDNVVYTLVAEVAANATSYFDTGLAAETQYWYRVASINSAGVSPFTGPVSQTTGEAPPPASAGLVIYATGAGVFAAGDTVSITRESSEAPVSSGGPFGEPYLAANAGAGYRIEGAPIYVGTSDFTAECWYRRTWSGTGGQTVFEMQRPGFSERLGVYSSNRTFAAPGPNVTPTTHYFMEGPGGLYRELFRQSALNSWRHFAVARQEGVMSAWENGQLVSSVWFNNNYSEPINYGENYIDVGPEHDVGQFRFTPGEAIYSGAVIAVPGTPFYTP
jgi:phage-related protein/WD40 repeat protein